MGETDVERQQNQRIYNLSDRLAASESKLVEHTTMLAGLTRQIEVMNATMVNRDLLTATVGTVVAKIENNHQENGLKFKHVDTLFATANSKLDDMTKNMNEKIDPIRRVINWTAGTIIGAVIIALLSLVIKSQ